jgi:hypothetical protein
MIGLMAFPKAKSRHSTKIRADLILVTHAVFDLHRYDRTVLNRNLLYLVSTKFSDTGVTVSNKDLVASHIYLVAIEVNILLTYSSILSRCLFRIYAGVEFILKMAFRRLCCSTILSSNPGLLHIKPSFARVPKIQSFYSGLLILSNTYVLHWDTR